jgi:metallo-beta-lactamase class B
MKLQAMQKTYAFKAFDQLYYVGNAFVGSFALTTPKGIILFDTMWDDQDAKDIIEPGLRKLGLNPADIKYIIVTHGHIDHWGGAKYFQDKYKSRVMQSAIDWVLTEGGTQKSMSFMGRPPQAPPKRDLVVHDGAVFSLGSTNVNLYILPGHTPGSLGIILPVTDHGVPHVAAMFGGNGLPMHLQKDIGPGPERDAGLLAYIASVKRFTRLGREAGADVAISTHPIFDGTIQYGAEIAHRAAGAPNPWVLGKNRWQRYMKVQLEVAETVKAMEIEHPVFKRGP